MTPLSEKTIRACVELVQKAAPHLQRTPDHIWLANLDEFKDVLIPVAYTLDGAEAAEYVIGVWRWALERGRFNECLDAILATRALRAEKTELKIEACVAVGILQGKQRQYKIAEEYINLAWSMANEMPFYRDRAFIRYHQAKLARLMNYLDRATKYHQESFQIACDNDDEWMLATNENEMGIAALVDGDLKGSKKYFLSAYKRYERLHEDRRALDVLSNIGLIALQQGFYEEAERTHRRCLKHYMNRGDPSYCAVQMQNLGTACIYTGKWNEAEFMLNQAFIQMIHLEFMQYIPVVLMSMGILCYKRQRFDNSVRLFACSETLSGNYPSSISIAEQQEIDKIIADIKAHMPSNNFSLEWEKGKQMELAHVTACLK